jgi:uncharacterized protein YbjT (DUF2867 family)
MVQTAVVTGATGFVATELVKQLLAKVGTASAGLIAIDADAVMWSQCVWL